jgi:hypothetical protein
VTDAQARPGDVADLERLGPTVHLVEV